MALIVEDGSIVANADSYVSLAEIKAYATSHGVTLGADTAIEVQAHFAIDYLESKRLLYQGMKVSENQSLQFPRYFVKIDGFDISETSIPKCLKNAQCQLVLEQASGVDLLPTQTEPAVKREVIGPISTEYAVSNGAINEPILLAVDALLQPLYKSTSGNAFSIRTVRV